MIGFLKGIRKIILIVLLSPFFLGMIVVSIIQYWGGVKPEETLIGKFNKRFVR
jgi:membrane protein DedA with SNARE-associated domain